MLVTVGAGIQIQNNEVGARVCLGCAAASVSGPIQVTSKQASKVMLLVTHGS
jgi:hypothetical protein